jgi:hypothetical protein
MRTKTIGWFQGRTRLAGLKNENEFKEERITNFRVDVFCASVYLWERDKTFLNIQGKGFHFGGNKKLKWNFKTKFQKRSEILAHEFFTSNF